DGFWGRRAAADQSPGPRRAARSAARLDLDPGGSAISTLKVTAQSCVGCDAAIRLLYRAETATVLNRLRCGESQARGRPATASKKTRGALPRASDWSGNCDTEAEHRSCGRTRY